MSIRHAHKVLASWTFWNLIPPRTSHPAVSLQFLPLTPFQDQALAQAKKRSLSAPLPSSPNSSAGALGWKAWFKGFAFKILLLYLCHTLVLIHTLRLFALVCCQNPPEFTRAVRLAETAHFHVLLQESHDNLINKTYGHHYVMRARPHYGLFLKSNLVMLSEPRHAVSHPLMFLRVLIKRLLYSFP